MDTDLGSKKRSFIILKGMVTGAKIISLFATNFDFITLKKKGFVNTFIFSQGSLNTFSGNYINERVVTAFGTYVKDEISSRYGIHNVRETKKFANRSRSKYDKWRISYTLLRPFHAHYRIIFFFLSICLFID